MSLAPGLRVSAAVVRFGPRRQATAWGGVLDAVADGPITPQLPSRLEPVIGVPERTEKSEDCLRLTITTSGAAVGASEALALERRVEGLHEETGMYVDDHLLSSALENCRAKPGSGEVIRDPVSGLLDRLYRIVDRAVRCATEPVGAPDPKCLVD